MVKSNEKPLTTADTSIVVCADKKDGGISGRIYCQLLSKPVEFTDIVNLIQTTEKIFDSYSFPHPYMAMRTFKSHRGTPEKRKEPLRHMVYDEMMANKGELGTFVVSIRYRQNATWQGSIKWVEEKKEMNFRSALEMLSLMKDAIGDEPGQEQPVSW